MHLVRDLRLPTVTSSHLQYIHGDSPACGPGQPSLHLKADTFSVTLKLPQDMPCARVQMIRRVFFMCPQAYLVTICRHIFVCGGRWKIFRAVCSVFREALRL